MVRSRGAQATGEASGLGGDLGLLLRKVGVACVAVDIVARSRLVTTVAVTNAKALRLAACATVVGEATVVLRPRPSAASRPLGATVRHAFGGDRATVRVVEEVAKVRRGRGVP